MIVCSCLGRTGKSPVMTWPILAGAMLVLSACSSTAPSYEDYMPRIGGDATLLESSSLEELKRLQLVATDLVASLVQVPELSPGSQTLQVSKPVTAFGSTLVRALEDAGYGLQRVSADQGQNYVTYSRRYSETEAGPVTDYSLAIGQVRLSREYIVEQTRIFPSSLMIVQGASMADQLVLDERIFQEQGGEGQAFISGVRDADASQGPTSVREVSVNDYDETPLAIRSSQSEVFAAAKKRRAIEMDSGPQDDLTQFQRLRRTVLIFDDPSTRLMGAGNKQAIRLLVRDLRKEDIFLVTACTDADGRNDAAYERGIRVEEEFVSHGIPAESVRLAPCRRTSFRHASDTSPVPVEIVQYRRR